MPMELTGEEARIIGCLMEKSVVTPDQYPLTLNALTNACNQKSSRDPVMSLSPGQVEGTARGLADKHLIRIEENFRTQVHKYTQRLCNTPFSDYQFEPPQFAIVCVLLLRGPRTPGELRSNSGRLYTFADNGEVVETLATLMEGEGAPVVVQLPRTPGRRDAEYMHLLSGPVESAARENPPARPATPVAPASPPSSGAASPANPNLEARLAALETEVAELRREVRELRSRSA